MNLDHIDRQGKKISTVDVNDGIFNQSYNESLVHQILVSYQSNSRGGNRAQKDRSMVKCSTRKPWKQKGTGRARAGTAASPLWRGGGQHFPSSPEENFTKKVNKKMYKAAMRSIFSELFRKNKLLIVEKFEIKQPKTKEFLKFAKKHELDNALIITKELDENLYLASRNVKNIECSDIRSINPVSLLKYEKVLMSLEALKLVEERIS